MGARVRDASDALGSEKDIRTGGSPGWWQRPVGHERRAGDAEWTDRRGTVEHVPCHFPPYDAPAELD